MSVIRGRRYRETAARAGEQYGQMREPELEAKWREVRVAGRMYLCG